MGTAQLTAIVTRVSPMTLPDGKIAADVQLEIAGDEHLHHHMASYMFVLKHGIGRSGQVVLSPDGDIVIDSGVRGVSWTYANVHRLVAKS